MKQPLNVLSTILAALLVAILAASAWAQTRTIPKQALRGELTHVTQNIVSVNGQTMRLAPGAQIYAQNNLTIVPTEVPPNSIVDYTLDRDGQIFKVWILTPQEAAQPNPNSPNGGFPGGGPPGTPIQQVLPSSPESGPATPPSGSAQPAQQ
jgi:hypothetical protein